MHTVASTDDTEITLGVGKLLGLFFLLAAICGVFFSIGYSLGKSSGREQALNDQPAQVAASDTTSAGSASSENKPSAAVAMKSDPQSPPADDAEARKEAGKLTFYKAVQQNGNGAQTVASNHDRAAPAVPAVKTVTTKTTEAVPSPSTAAATRTSATVISHTSPVTGPGTMVVQIAAIAREDDAVSLAGALRKKNYNVFVVNNPVTRDRLYHVQVGPFATLADAEAMKAKLVAEGYNPIIKR